VDWKRIKAEYIAGGTSYRKLAQKYGITLAVLRNVAEREEWVNLKAQAQHKTNTKIVNAVSDIEAKKAVDIIAVADKLLEQIEDMLTTSPITSTQSLKNITSALKDLKEIKGCKSDADMREQEARIAKLRKEAEREDDNVNEIEIVFNAGPEEWNG
jgi:hypothetical protein